MGMLLGGVSVDDRRIRELAGLVQKPLGTKLETAVRFRARVVGLTAEEKSAILRALENAPSDLKETRERLLADESWRPSTRLT